MQPLLWAIHLQLQWASLWFKVAGLLRKVAGHLLHKSCYIHFQTNKLLADFTPVAHG